MSKRASEAAMKAYPSHVEIITDIVGKQGDLHEFAREVYQEGYELAEKDLGWHSVDECLPEIDEEVIVLTDELGTAPIYKIGFGHIVKPATYKLKIDSEIKEFKIRNHDGWNIPGVKFWMSMPIIPDEK